MIDETDYFIVHEIVCGNPDCQKTIKLTGGMKITKTTKLYCDSKCCPPPTDWNKESHGIKPAISESDAEEANRFCDGDRCEIPTKPNKETPIQTG